MNLSHQSSFHLPAITTHVFPYQKFHWINLINRFLVLLAGFFILFFLVLIKAKTTVAFSADPLLYIYTLFVTTFVLSRISSAMLFEKVQQMEKHNLPPLEEKEPWPNVTFVIPCKNEESAIANTLRKCYQVDYPLDKIEIIAINDGSTDDTLSVLLESQKTIPNLKIIGWKKNRGKRYSMVTGFLLAQGDIVVQLDSDSYIEPTTFPNLILPFRNPKISAVCAHADPQNASKNWITRMQAAYYFVSFRILKAGESAYQNVFCCSGCSSAYRKSAVLPVLDKWFQEKFLGRMVTWGEDRSLTSHLLKNGQKTIYTDQVQSYTIVPENIKQLLTQHLRWKKSWIINSIFTSKFIWKKQPFIAFFYYFPLVLISFLTPLITIRALIYLPLFKGVWPLYHVFGVFLITALLSLYYRTITKVNTYWPYLFVWSFFNLFILSFLMLYALIKIQDRGWGTR